MMGGWGVGRQSKAKESVIYKLVLGWVGLILHVEAGRPRVKWIFIIQNIKDIL